MEGIQAGIKGASLTPPPHQVASAPAPAILAAGAALANPGIEIALVMLLVAPAFTQPRLVVLRGWVERHARTIIAIVLLGLGVSLLRDGVTGLTT